MEKILNQILDEIKNLEENLVNEISSSRVETEMILRQIATYLSVSIQNLSEIHENALRVNSFFSEIKNEVLKINKIEELITQLPNETVKTKEFIDKKFSAYTTKINICLGNISAYLKKILEQASEQNKKLSNIENSYSTLVDLFKGELGKNQEGLAQIINKLLDQTTEQGRKLGNIESSYTSLTDLFKSELGKNQDSLSQVINKLLDSKSATITASADVKKTKITQDVEKYKTKSDLWVKVLGIILGSGGVLYVIIDLIMKALGN